MQTRCHIYTTPRFVSALTAPIRRGCGYLTDLSQSFFRKTRNRVVNR